MMDAFALLTVFGRGGSITARSSRWFPVVGAVLGLLLGGWWWLTAELWPAAIAAALVVAADLAATGMLHADGLADAADGLLPHADRDRRLEIMRTPGVGAFGVTALVVVLLLRLLALATLPVSVALLAALWCASRSVVAAVPAVLPYAREHGIASPLAGSTTIWPALGAGVALGVAAAADGWSGTVGVAVGVLAGVGVLALAQRRLGGFTGDVLGAVVLVVETVGLVVAAARW
jgi:adenosylcobinamide-GDP ribazoletransferase